MMMTCDGGCLICHSLFALQAVPGGAFRVAKETS